MMAIPDYQSIMLPVLQAFGDGTVRRIRDLIPGLADRFGLSAEERRELLPSGTQVRLDNRVHWAASYMKQAGLLEYRGPRLLVITQRGRDLLAEQPAGISVKGLERYPEFLEFKARTKIKTPGAQVATLDDGAKSNPEETLEAAWQDLREQLAQELLERVRAASPTFFEHLVVDLLVKMGYGGSQADAAQVVGGSGDAGIDGVIKQDRLGLDAVYVQAKRWEAQVGRPLVQGFAGSLDGRQATKGVMITTSSFSADAKDFVERIAKRIILIDGETLAQYMIEFGVGVATARTYDVKRVDLDYYEDV
jgi:restriction system protein